MKVSELEFETHPRDMGQIVTYSYADTEEGYTILRRYDASDGRTTFYWHGRCQEARLMQSELDKYGLVEKT